MTPSRHPVWPLVAAPASLIYGAGIRLWLLRWRWGRAVRLRHPVISVGNITTGGTGKTPLVECLARRVDANGWTASILSRGYRRDGDDLLAVSEGNGPLTEPPVCGDEPYLLARNASRAWVTVSKDRAAAGRAAEARAGRCIHILDDGYQHLRLARDLNILLLDATDPFGGERLVPWGRLREPLSGLGRADLIVITRADHPFEESVLVRRIKQLNLRAPILYAYNEVEALVDIRTREPHPPREFFRRRMAAFAGVANPGIFFRDLAHHQIEVLLQREFPDHHRYRQAEIDRMGQEALAAGAEALITTEKDEINLRGLKLPDCPCYYLRIRARFAEESQLDFYLQEVLT